MNPGRFRMDMLEEGGTGIILSTPDPDILAAVGPPAIGRRT
jgi:hypothetical protein